MKKSDPDQTTPHPSANPIPPIQRYTIDLRSLNKDEEELLRTVLERDYLQMEILDTRLSDIRHDIQEIRKRGALAQGDNPNTMCARCKHKFWLIPLPLTDRGARCFRCKFRVCRLCRSKEFNGTWMCSLCFRYREEKILSGEWMFKGLCTGLHGSDLLRASLKDKGRVAEDHYVDLPGTNRTVQYIQKPALTKGDDSGSRTSLNSASVGKTLHDEEDERSDSSTASSRRGGNNCSGGSNSGGGYGATVDDSSSSCGENNIASEVVRSDLEDTTDGQRGGHAVTGSNNSHFARLQTPERPKGKDKPQAAPTDQDRQAGSNFEKSNKATKHTEEKKKHKHRKKKNDDGKNVGIRALLEKHPQDKEKPKRKKKKRLLNELGDPIDIAADEEMNDDDAKDKKEKTKEKKENNKDKKPKVANDENQSCRRAVVERNTSETRKVTISLDVSSKPGPSTMVSEYSDPKSNHKGKESKSKQSHFSRGKVKSGSVNEMAKYSPQSESNIFAHLEMNTNNHDIELIDPGKKEVDKMTENLDIKRSVRGLNQNDKLLKRPDNRERKPPGSNVKPLPPGLRQLVDCFWKRSTNTRSPTCVFPPREAVCVDVEVPKTKVKKDFAHFHKGVKGGKSKTAKKALLHSTLMSNKMDAVDPKKHTVDTPCGHSKLLKHINLQDGQGNDISKCKTNNKLYNELEESRSNQRFPLSTNKTPKIRSSQSEDILFQNTDFNSEGIRANRPTVRLFRLGRHNKREESGASGDGKGFLLSDISGANTNVNFHPSRTIIKNKEERDKLSRRASKTNQLPRKSSLYRLSNNNLPAPGDLNYEPWKRFDNNSLKDIVQDLSNPDGGPSLIGIVIVKNKMITNQRKDRVSGLEAFRSKARGTPGPYLPKMVLSSQEKSNETTRPNELHSTDYIDGDTMHEEEERKFMLHWHETLRRKSVDEENLKRRKQSFGFVDKPLMSTTKEPLFRDIVSLIIPEKPTRHGQSSQLSPTFSTGSTSSQESISSYLRHFVENSSSTGRMTSTPSMSPKDIRKSEDTRSPGTPAEATPSYPSVSPSVSFRTFAWIKTGMVDRRLRKSESDRWPSTSSDYRGRKLKRKYPETIEETTPSPLEVEDGNANASAQRRDSYSKALENQKIRVILPLGNDDSVDGGDITPHSNSASPLHDGHENDSDKESIDSSLSSHSSHHPMSKNASTNSSFSSRSSRSMPSDMRARELDSDHISEEDESDRPNEPPYHDLHAGGVEVDSAGRNTSGGIPRGSNPRDGKGSVAASGRDSSPGRQESFEEIYDSNVNRLVQMMTGGDAVSDSDTSEARKSPRLLPRPPESGKDSEGREMLLQKSLSLSEELEANAKYLDMDDNKDDDGGDDCDDNSDIHADSIDVVNIVEDNRVDRPEGGVDTGESIDDQSGSFYSSLASEDDLLSSESGDTPCTQQSTHPNESYFSMLKHKHGLVSSEDTGLMDNEITQDKSSPQNEFESLEDQDLLLTYLRTPENDVPYEIRLSLCRNNSNASDALSRITELSEPRGEAESPNSGESSDSDDTLHGGNFEESFSDDNEALENSKGSVINIYEVGSHENLKNQTGSQDDKDCNLKTENDIPMKQDDKPDSTEAESAQYSRLPGHEPSSEDVSADQGSHLEGFGETLKADVSLSSSILSEFDLDNEPEDVQDLARTSKTTPTASGSQTPAKSSNESNGDQTDSSFDQEEASEEEEERMREKRLGKDRRDLTRQPCNPVIKIEPMENNHDSVRDSDSGVNSSQTSRANTPEQRSLSSEKGINQNSNAFLRPHQVPSISVTEEFYTATKERNTDVTNAKLKSRSGNYHYLALAFEEQQAREEDDDLDELFQKHRPIGGSSNLSARSSLRDSRESLYSVYSAAGEENYGNIPVTGEIMFHLEYDYKASMLEVHIKQCKDLAPVDTKRNRSDPYVKTYLLPDKSRNGKRKTKIKRHSLNPTYNEVLHYPISKTELESRSLWIAVWNNDRFGRNDFLGEVTIPLDYYEFDKAVPLWYALQDRIPDDAPAMTYKGDLFISIKYVPASMVGSSSKRKSGSLKRGKDKGVVQSGLGEIHVMVKEAQNLTAMRSSAGSNPFCKGYLLPDQSHSSKQKTPVIKKTTNPHWQHLLVFEGVDETQLENHGVELTIWDHEKLSSNDFLGGVRLNLGSGFIKGKPTDWMDAQGEEIEAWQSMVDTHNEWVDAQLPLRASMGKQNIKK